MNPQTEQSTVEPNGWRELAAFAKRFLKQSKRHKPSRKRLTHPTDQLN